MMLVSSYYVVYCLFVSKHNSALREVVGTHLHLHLVAGKNLDVVHPHLA